MAVTLQGIPLKIIHKGTFLRQSNEKLYETVDTALGSRNVARKGLRITTQKVAGGVYIVFNCPGCSVRNKKALKSAKYSSSHMVAFLCHSCMNIVEVDLTATSKPENESRIILP